VSDFVIISHPDGRRYSVTLDAYAAIYELQGFAIDREEGPDDFVADVPTPRPSRGRPAAKRLLARSRAGVSD
jgi:hypothetical protein